MSIITSFYQQLYNDDEEPVAVARTDDLIPEIIISEIECVIKNMKNCKSPGEDGLTAEMFKYGGNDLIQAMKILFNKIQYFKKRCYQKHGSIPTFLLFTKVVTYLI